MVTLGKIKEFVFASKDWPQYKEHLSYYFITKGIESAEKKLAELLTVIGAATYKILCSLVAPSS